MNQNMASAHFKKSGVIKKIFVAGIQLIIGSHAKTFEGRLAAVPVPMHKLFHVQPGVHHHLVVITPQGMYGVSLFPQLKDKINHPLAVRPPVDIIAETIEHIRFLQIDFFQNQFPERLAASVKVADGKGSGHIMLRTQIN